MHTKKSLDERKTKLAERIFSRESTDFWELRPGQYVVVRGYLYRILKNPTKTQVWAQGIGVHKPGEYVYKKERTTKLYPIFNGLYYVISKREALAILLNRRAYWRAVK